MKEILEFANTISPIGVIALLAIVILQITKNSGVIGKLRGTQIRDADKVSNKKITEKIDLFTLNSKLDKITNNHLHELPEMKRTLDRIEEKQNLQGERLACVETSVKILLKQ